MFHARANRPGIRRSLRAHLKIRSRLRSRLFNRAGLSSRLSIAPRPVRIRATGPATDHLERMMKRNTAMILMAVSLMAASALSEAKIQGSGVAIADATLLHARVEREHRAQALAHRAAASHAAQAARQTEGAPQHS
ncbi:MULTISPECIES: hypothetical protein [Burkholderia]|uniref:Uncharacterized protein n=2 Tax=Burkholderia TaxID=32008 RepID=A0A7T6VJH7_9BURK|nr:MULTISPECIES: hypothetical protein [Burkholderia]MBY4870371.1 hypothetical protein [Burkholderia anthina]QQK05110.1 hypothetical protein JFN94_27850 [Burkholderia anthina]